MGTPKESRNSKDMCSTRVNSKSSMSSSCQDLSEQSSPASSQILSNESRLSDISQATNRSLNNNARITSGKKSGSSHVFTPELSNRSQLSAKDQQGASDRSLPPVKGQRISTPRNKGDVQNTQPTGTPMRSSRSALRQDIPTEYANFKESLRKRKNEPPHRDSPRKPLRADNLKNVASTLSKINQIFEIERADDESHSSTEDAAQHKESNKTPKSFRFSSQRSKGKTGENQEIPKPKSEAGWNKLKKSTDDKYTKGQFANNLPSKLPIPCQNNKRQAELPVEIPKHITAEPVLPACRNSKTSYTKRKEISKRVPQQLNGKPNSFQTSGSNSNKPRSQLQGSMAKNGSTTSVPESKSKLSNSMIRKKKHSLDRRTAKQKHPKPSNELRAEFDTTDQQESFSGKDSVLDAVQIEEYFKLLDIYNENERTIEDNQRQIDLQEKEMDKLYPVVREEIDNMAGCIGEMARIRMIHKNFKDEASRVRVHHKTNLIETDIYEEANTELKEHISYLNQEIIEVKAINGLRPEDVQTKAEMIWKQCDDQRQTNVSLEKEIQKLKNDLNAYMCDIASPSKPDAEGIADLISDIESKPELPRSILLTKDKRAGESKSADEVSSTKECEEDPREIKSDHQQESRFKKILRSARGLLPDRKRKQRDQKNKTDTTDKPHLLEKRYLSGQNAESNILMNPIARNDMRLPPISAVPVESRINYTHKVSNFSLFTQQPSQYKLHHKNILPSIDWESNQAVRTPHPPVSPRPENVCLWKLRTTRNLKNK